MIDFLVILNLAIAIIITLHSIKQSGRNFFEPIYFFLLGFVGVFVLQVYYGQREMLAVRDEYTIYLASTLSWMALIVFYVGYRSSFAKRIFLKLPQPPREWHPGELTPYGIFLILLGIAGQLYFIFKSGGVETYFSVARGAGAYETTTAYIYRLKWLCIPGFAVLFIEVARSRNFTIKFLCYVLALLFFLFQLCSGQRSGIFLVIVSLFAWYYLPRIRETKIPTIKIFSAIIIALVLVGFVASFRDEFYLGSDFYRVTGFFDQTFTEEAQQIYLGLVTGGTNRAINSEFDGFVETLEAVPDKIGHDYGLYYTRYLYYWVPRSLWPEKPTMSELKQEIVKAVSTLYCGTITMFGMYYLNFGFLGIFIGSYVTGIILGGLEYWRKSDMGNFGVLIIYLVFFQVGRGFLMSGGLLEDIDTIIPFYLLPCVGAFYYLKAKRRLIKTGCV